MLRPMRQAAASPYVSFEDYVEAEVGCAEDAPRHEWCDGVIYAMSRGSPEHGRLTARMTVVLGGALAAECQLYSSDTMLYIAAAKLATYADAIVVCGTVETETVRKGGKSLGRAVTNPTVVIEVLSDSTERYDRDGKFQANQQLPSLREYVLVSQDLHRIEVFRRSRAWTGEIAGRGEVIDIHRASIAVDAVYR